MPSDYPSLPGMQADWDVSKLTPQGNGTSVQNLTDCTGNGHDMVQATSGSRPIYTTPAFGSLPALQFTGSKSMSATAFTAAYTQVAVYAVYKILGHVTNQFGLSVNHTSGMSMDLGSDDFIGNQDMRATGTPSSRVQMYTGLSLPYGSCYRVADYLGEDFGVAAFSYDGSGIIGLSNNGNDVFQTADHTGSGSLTLSGAFSLGQSSNGSFPFDGLLAQVIVCDQYHTPLQRRNQIDALMTKWSIIAQDELYTSGDSITAGYLSSGSGAGQGSWPKQTIDLLTGRINFYNFGVNATNTLDADTRAASYCDPYVLNSSSRGRSIIVMSLGTNDITGTVGEDAAIFARIVTAVQNRKAAEPTVRVLVGTVIIRGSGAPFESVRQLLNQRIRTAASPAWDGIVDFARTNTDGSLTAASSSTLLTSAFFDVYANNTNTTYIGDGTHPVNAGYLAMATQAAAVIAALPASRIGSHFHPGLFSLTPLSGGQL